MAEIRDSIVLVSRAQRRAYMRAEALCESYGNAADQARFVQKEPADKAFEKGKASAASELRSMIANLSESAAPSSRLAVSTLLDAQLKDAICEMLSCRGERPERILRGGQALWETWLPAFRACLSYIPTSESAS